MSEFFRTTPPGLLTDDDAGFLTQNWNAVPAGDRRFYVAKLNEWQNFREHYPRPYTPSEIAERQRERVRLGEIFSDFDKATEGDALGTLQFADADQAPAIKQGLANRAFVQHMTGLEGPKLESDYELARDALAKKLFGGAGVADDATFHAKAAEWVANENGKDDVHRSLVEAGRRAAAWEGSGLAERQRPTLKTWQESQTGKPGYGLDFSGEYERTFKAAQAEAKQEFDRLRPYVDAAWSLLNEDDSFVPDQPGAVDFEALADRLMEIPYEDRRKVLAMVKARAELLPEKQQEGFWSKADKTFLRTIEGMASGAAFELPRIVGGLGSLGGPDLERQTLFEDIRNLRWLDMEPVVGSNLREKAGLGIVGSLPGMALMGGGWMLNIPAFASDARQTIRTDLEKKGVSPQYSGDLANGFALPAGIAMGVLERVTFGMADSLPGVKQLQAKLVTRLSQTAVKKAAAYAMAGVLELGEQQLQEALQDSTPLILVDVAQTLGAPLPEVEAWAPFMQTMKDPSAWAVSLVFAGVGFGRMPSIEAAATLREHGASEQQIETVLAAPDGETWRAAVQDAIQNPAGTPVASPPAAVVEGAQAAENAEAGVTGISRTSEGWWVNHTDGRRTRVDTATEAVSLVSDLAQLKSAEETAWLASQLEIADDLAKRGGGEVSLETEFRVGETKTASQARLEAAVAEDAGAEERLLEQSRLRAVADGADAATVEIVQGANRVEFVDRVARSASQIFEGAMPSTVIHENAHGSFKAGLQAGIFTEAGTLQIIRHVEKATGQTFIAEADDTKVGFVQLDEAVAELAEAELIGQRKGSRLMAPGKVNRALRSFGDLVATNDASRAKEAKGFKHFLGALRGLMRQVFRRALALRKAKSEGKLGDDYDAFIEKLLRVDTQAGHNRRVLEAAGVTVQDLATSNVRAPRNVDLAAFRDRARAEVSAAPSFSLDRRAVDLEKIKSILDGTYEPDADDHLAARTLERAVRTDERLRRAFNGKPIAATPHLLGKSGQLGAAILAQLSGPRFITYSSESDGAPNGLAFGSVLGVRASQAKHVHLVAGHEMWHWLKNSHKQKAARIGALIEAQIDSMSLDSAVRGYERDYGSLGAATDEVAANIFASALSDPDFWWQANPSIAEALNALPENAPFPESRLIQDWPAFVRGVAEIMVTDSDPSLSLTSADVLDRIAPRLAAAGQPPKARRQMYADAQAEIEGMARSMRHNDSLGKPTPKREMLRALAALDAILIKFPAEVRGKVGGFTRLASFESNKGRENFLKNRIEKLGVVLERHLRRQYSNDLAKLFLRAKPAKGKPGEKPTGKLTADAQSIINAAQAAMVEDATKVLGRVASLDAQIATGQLSPEAEQLAETERDLVQLTGDWKNADAARMAAAVEAVETVLDDGLIERAKQRADIRARRDQARGALMVATGKLGTPAERQERHNRETGQDKQLGVVANFHGATRGTVKKWQLSLSSFEEVLRYAFGDSKAAQQLVDAERTASNQYEDGVQTITDKVASFFTKRAGSALEGEKMRYRLSQRSIVTGNSWGTLSEMQTIQALLMWRQEDGRRHMEAHNIDDQWIARVEGQMTEDGRAVMALLENLYAAEYAPLNALYRQRHGMNLPHHANYAPITVTPQQAKAGQMIDPVSGQPTSGSVLTPGSLRTRSKVATAEPRFDDALAVFVAHTRQMEFWKAYYDVAVDAQSILGNRNLMNSVEASAGKEAVNALGGWVTLIGQGGHRDAATHLAANQMLQQITGRAARMALVGRVGTLIIQSTQLAAAAAEMPTGAYISRFGKLMTGNLNWGDALRSDFIKRRIKQMPPVVQQAMQGLDSTDPNIVKHAAQRVGQLISGADGLFTAGTYAILLDYHRGLAKDLGLTGVDADTYAHQQAERSTERVAQPTRMGTRSLFENTLTSPIAKLSWAFASEGRQKLSLFAWALKSGDPKRIAKATFLTWVVGGLMSAVIRNAWQDFRDDDDDEVFDERFWNLKRLFIQSIAGPLQGIPGLGDAIEQGIGRLAGTYIPNGGLLDSIPKSALATKNLATLDFLDDDEPVETVLRDVESLMMGAGLFGETMASAASLAHIVRDGAAIVDNLSPNTEDEAAAKKAAANRRTIKEWEKSHPKPEKSEDQKAAEKARRLANEAAQAAAIRAREGE